MYRAEFASSDPLNDLPRVLDSLRNLGFQLRRASVEAEAGESARISVQFLPAGQLSVSTFIERISRMPGIERVTHGSLQVIAS